MNCHSGFARKICALGLLLAWHSPLFSQTDTLRLVFAGDIMGHAPQIASAKVGAQYDYAPCFKYVKPILERADIAIGNLELTLPMHSKTQASICS
jgi:poly-gamma-glutamate synthesis protein (capsule biosynthesis protein)